MLVTGARALHQPGPAAHAAPDPPPPHLLRQRGHARLELEAARLRQVELLLKRAAAHLQLLDAALVLRPPGLACVHTVRSRLPVHGQGDDARHYYIASMPRPQARLSLAMHAPAHNLMKSAHI